MPSTRAAGPTAVLHLRAHREARGLTVWQLAAASGVSRVTVYRLEGPDARQVDFLVLGALAHALGIAPGALFAPPAPPTPTRTRPTPTRR